MTSLDRKRSAVLVMDYQAGILGRLGEDAAPLVERAAAVVSAARAGGVPVIYVVVGFRPGYPEASPNNASFAQIAKSGLFVTDKPGSDIDPTLQPAPNDVIIFKHRVGPFLGTDLDQVLRAQSIDTLVLLGISTSGVVLSTVRYGADADYKILIAADGCADPDPEVHRVLMEKVLSKQATIITCADAIAALKP